LAKQKIKTNRSAAKRFSKTGTGKIKYRKAFKGHLLSKKSAKRKRSLSKDSVVSKQDFRRVSRQLPN
jgi:large subunit ribosomal protein L35